MVALLEEKIEGFQACLFTLHFIKESKEFLNRMHEALFRRQQVKEVKISQQMEAHSTQKEGAWKKKEGAWHRSRKIRGYSELLLLSN